MYQAEVVGGWAEVVGATGTIIIEIHKICSTHLVLEVGWGAVGKKPLQIKRI